MVQPVSPYLITVLPVDRLKTVLLFSRPTGLYLPSLGPAPLTQTSMQLMEVQTYRGRGVDLVARVGNMLMVNMGGTL